LIWRPALVANGNEFIMDKQIDWAPGLTATNDSDFRLPTIKELIRLVDYDFTDSQGDYDESKGGFTDPLIEYWLKNKCQANTLGSNDCSSQSVTIDNREAQVDRDGYLISSTYANVDGDVTGASSSHSTVYGIRIKDGHVVLMESGGKGGVFRHHPDKQGMLALCPGLLTDNTNTIVTGHCDYQVNDQPDSGSADTEGAEYSVVAVYALLVKEL